VLDITRLLLNISPQLTFATSARVPTRPIKAAHSRCPWHIMVTGRQQPWYARPQPRQRVSIRSFVDTRPTSLLTLSSVVQVPDDRCDPPQLNFQPAVRGPRHMVFTTHTIATISPNMRRNGVYPPVPPQAFGPGPQRLPGPLFADMHTIHDDLDQLRAYNNQVHDRLMYFGEQPGPSVRDKIGQIKKESQESLRALERLQQRVMNQILPNQQRAGNDVDAAMLEDLEQESWTVYKIIMALEARINDADPERSDTYLPPRARRVMVAEARPNFFIEQDDGPGYRPISMGPPMNVIQPQPVRVRQYRSIEGALGRANSRMYPTSGALPRRRGPVCDAGNRNVDLHEDGSTLKDSSSDAATNLYTNYSPDSVPSLDQTHLVLTKTRAEVEQDCFEEENMGTPILNGPDRRRTGSVPSYFATFAIMARLNDPDYYLPQFHHIKKCEVKDLKECLEERNVLQRTGNISRIEKLLHLLFLLQDGVRFETIAVLFSRTPRQVQASCDRVFEGLLHLHGDTAVPQLQPTCYHLWKISLKYLAADTQSAQHAERYYGWRTIDVVKVLVTLNVFIGRYREQGRVALDGAYCSWWRACSDNVCPEQ
jgi:hypothetical protein